jgi:hypothetical protein
MIRNGNFILGVGILLAACSQGSAPPIEETLDPWVFSVPEITLSCEANDHGGKAVFATTAAGERYAVNGMARSRAPLMEPIQTHYDTDHVIKAGLALCDSGKGPTRFVPPATSEVAAEQTAPIFAIEESQTGEEGIFASIESRDLVAGKRPKLTLVCMKGASPSIQMRLVAEPAKAPPLRGVFASYVVGQGEAESIEVAWALEDSWMVRTEENRNAAAGLVSGFVREGQLTIQSLAAAGIDHAITWQFSTFGAEQDRVRQACSP